ncbi:hypothetical protein RN001_011164 [Aquatica leii]|uniref:Meckel syndrome type 1 protein n=1 Tax=Aquatica leii TaxID=1421715 RepID=A0AAN7QHZ1_9COLE|nr:hypothetical protein RN001_011164 [Aquatica leii]
MYKYTAVYRSPDDITNLKIRIKIVENDECIEEKIFEWQQKVFGKFERNFYRDKRNCITDLEKKYHDDISKALYGDYLLFSYVNEDGFGSDSHKSDDKFETMHLMGDLSEFEPTVLCTIKYETTHKYFTLNPDFTQSQPYTIQIETDTKKNYRYYVEDASDKIPLETQLKENEILHKITSHQVKVRMKKAGTDFEVPSKNKLNFYLFCEILSGRNFEYNDIYVQYIIELPKNWSCRNGSNLSGSTFTSHSSSSDGLSYFGFPFEVYLECNLLEVAEDVIVKAPCIYFEIISKDSWDRFRSEGVAYTILPISRAGVYTYELQCVRTCPAGPKGDLRRFFIGDFSSRSNLNWVALPKEHEQKEVVNKYGIVTVATGQINIRINVLQQSQAFADEPTTKKRTKFILEKLDTSGLIRSVEQVVAAFKIAKRKMIEAKKNI